MLKVFAVFSSLFIFSIVVWILIPAPAFFVWLLSVAASEWSLWFGIVSFLLVIFSVCFLIFGGGKIYGISLIFSLTAFFISLYPLLSSLKTAKENNVSISISEYFSGMNSQKSSGNTFTTRTFASVDGKDLQMDIFAPRTQNENNGAAIIVVHGGSWNGRSRNDFPQWNEWLAENGYTIFDIDSPPNFISLF